MLSTLPSRCQLAFLPLPCGHALLKPCSLPAAGYSNSGVLAAVALLTVTLANPMLLVLPHAVALLGTIWRWAGGRQAAGANSASWRGLQIYTGQSSHTSTNIALEAVTC